MGIDGGYEMTTLSWGLTELAGTYILSDIKKSRWAHVNVKLLHLVHEKQEIWPWTNQTDMIEFSKMCWLYT